MNQGAGERTCWSGSSNSYDSVVEPAFIALLLGKVGEKLSCRFPLDAFALMLCCQGAEPISWPGLGPGIIG